MSQYIRCEACGNKFFEVVVRECPKKVGHWICQYCCWRCKRSYGYIVGRGCRAWDEASKEREGSNGSPG